MNTGHMRFFRNINLNFAKDCYGYIFPIDFYVDINFQASDDFTFITFMKKRESNYS